MYYTLILNKAVTMPKGVQGVFMDYWIKIIIMIHYQTFMFTH